MLFHYGLYKYYILEKENILININVLYVYTFFAFTTKVFIMYINIFP